MCTICSAFRPYTPTCDYEDLTGPSGTGTVGAGVERMQDLPVFTNAQIAEVLTDGFWEDRNLMRRTVDAGPDDVVTFDVSGLTTEAQVLARFAIEAWDELLPFEFVELTGTTEESISADGDAGDTLASATVLELGERIVGGWDGFTDTTPQDQDFYAVDLVAGQTYTAALVGLSGLSVELVLRDPNGDVIASEESQLVLENNAVVAGDGIVDITFAAAETGTYYIEAVDGFESDSAYSLTISEGTTIGERPSINFDDRGADPRQFPIIIDDNTLDLSLIEFSLDYLNNNGTTLDSNSFQIYIHEVGHALGLGHAGFYNFVGNYEESAHYANDSIQASIMSYWSQEANTTINASEADVVTPMIADILAIEELYGPLTIREGDTVYGANSNVEGYLGTLFGLLFDGEEDPDLYAGGPIALTVADTGGTDTIDLSTVEVAQRVDLDPGAISNVGGLVGNMVIAENTVIERFEGGTAEDRVFGNAADNVIDGNAGDDILRGGTGDDVVRGGAGDDAVYGGSGDDRATGGSGNDTVIGSSGNDELLGNGGRDRLDGNSGNDDLDGGAQADELRGHDGVDRLWGGDGGDYLSGGGGNDRLFGGDARDFVYGGQGDDRVAGDAGSDRLYGQSGDDYLIGGADTDWLYGGIGADTFLFGETFDRDLVRDFEDDIDTLFINDNLWSGTRNAQEVLNDFATLVDGDVVFDFGEGDVLIVENVASVDALANDLVIV